MEAVIDRSTVKEISERYQALTEFVPLKSIHNDADYENAIVALNQLMDAGGADEKSPLAELVNSLGSLIADYEDMQPAVQSVSPVATLKFLMTQHQLTQSDLPELGSQGVVSEVLRGIRDLNVRQMKALADRFHVPASVFL
ncbi:MULTISPECIES: type II toxin-antitoxin system HigA family antitoxin [unclassified Undibacterium]|uniref:helix-turn-helix domain-containing protein n=1 Tax=unclassified Undibacterium TaxID=2630295 RepID=UPI00164AD4B6|nr:MULTISPECIES: transcriptional regulator [unclassified Undibacterium]MBC3876817.1 transcriptional regulator [Undibacterium sp. FT79W]MBC3928483.1 transcriptional regulator [Undibacterium sp. CY21W]